MRIAVTLLDNMNFQQNYVLQKQMIKFKNKQFALEAFLEFIRYSLQSMFVGY